MCTNCNDIDKWADFPMTLEIAENHDKYMKCEGCTNLISENYIGYKLNYCAANVNDPKKCGLRTKN